VPEGRFGNGLLEPLTIPVLGEVVGGESFSRPISCLIGLEAARISKCIRRSLHPEKKWLSASIVIPFFERGLGTSDRWLRRRGERQVFSDRVSSGKCRARKRPDFRCNCKGQNPTVRRRGLRKMRGVFHQAEKSVYYGVSQNLSTKISVLREQGSSGTMNQRMRCEQDSLRSFLSGVFWEGTGLVAPKRSACERG